MKHIPLFEQFINEKASKSNEASNGAPEPLKLKGIKINNKNHLTFTLEISYFIGDEVVMGYLTTGTEEEAQDLKNKVEKAFVVFCHIKLIQHTKDFVTTFESEVVKLDEVLECFHVSGDYDYILKVHVKDMDEYREFMITKLTSLQHIGSTHSSFMIGEVKNTTAFTL